MGTPPGVVAHLGGFRPTLVQGVARTAQMVGQGVGGCRRSHALGDALPARIIKLREYPAAILCQIIDVVGCYPPCTIFTRRLLLEITKENQKHELVVTVQDHLRIAIFLFQGSHHPTLLSFSHASGHLHQSHNLI